MTIDDIVEMHERAKIDFQVNGSEFNAGIVANIERILEQIMKDEWENLMG